MLLLVYLYNLQWVGGEVSAVVDSISNPVLMDQINSGMTVLETSISNIITKLQGTVASVDIDSTTPSIINGDSLTEQTRNSILDSARQGMNAQSTLRQWFLVHNDYYVTRAQNGIPWSHVQLDRFEAQFTMYSDACARFADACKNMRR